MIPRGIRNNNPGNIEKGEAWQGLSKDQSSDPRFCVFDAPEYGIRAIEKILISYENRGINTITKIIETWAPSVENNTQAYIDAVAASSNISPTEIIDIKDPKIANPIIKAIILHENGEEPYSDDIINKGLELAGLTIS